MSDEQVLEHFKEVFPPMIEPHKLEIDDREVPFARDRWQRYSNREIGSSCCFTQNCCSPHVFSMLVPMTERYGDTKTQERLSKMKPYTFHRVFCKTGIDPEGLTSVTPKTAKKMTTGNLSMQQQLRAHFWLEEITATEVLEEVEYHNMLQMTGLVNKMKITLEFSSRIVALAVWNSQGKWKLQR